VVLFRSDLLKYLFIQVIFHYKKNNTFKLYNYGYIYTFRMLKMYAKKEKMTEMVLPFTTVEWKFDNSNTKELWTLLSQDDRKTFWFSFEQFDWKSYVQGLVFGIRKYILKEDLNNVTKALSKNKKYIKFFIFNFRLYCYYVCLIIFSGYFGCISCAFVLLFTSHFMYVGCLLDY